MDLSVLLVGAAADAIKSQPNLTLEQFLAQLQSKGRNAYKYYVQNTTFSTDKTPQNTQTERRVLNGDSGIHHAAVSTPSHVLSNVDENQAAQELPTQTSISPNSMEVDHPVVSTVPPQKSVAIPVSTNAGEKTKTTDANGEQKGKGKRGCRNHAEGAEYVRKFLDLVGAPNFVLPESCKKFESLPASAQERLQIYEADPINQKKLVRTIGKEVREFNLVYDKEILKQQKKISGAGPRKRKSTSKLNNDEEDETIAHEYQPKRPENIETLPSHKSIDIVVSNVDNPQAEEDSFVSKNSDLLASSAANVEVTLIPQPEKVELLGKPDVLDSSTLHQSTSVAISSNGMQISEELSPSVAILVDKTLPSAVASVIGHTDVETAKKSDNGQSNTTVSSVTSGMNDVVKNDGVIKSPSKTTDSKKASSEQGAKEIDGSKLKQRDVAVAEVTSKSTQVVSKSEDGGSSTVSKKRPHSEVTKSEIVKHQNKNTSSSIQKKTTSSRDVEKKPKKLDKVVIKKRAGSGKPMKSKYFDLEAEESDDGSGDDEDDDDDDDDLRDFIVDDDDDDEDDDDDDDDDDSDDDDEEDDEDDDEDDGSDDDSDDEDGSDDDDEEEEEEDDDVILASDEE